MTDMSRVGTGKPGGLTGMAKLNLESAAKIQEQADANHVVGLYVPTVSVCCFFFFEVMWG